MGPPAICGCMSGLCSTMDNGLPPKSIVHLLGGGCYANTQLIFSRDIYYSVIPSNTSSLPIR